VIVSATEEDRGIRKWFLGADGRGADADEHAVCLELRDGAVGEAQDVGRTVAILDDGFHRDHFDSHLGSGGCC
jgi:hypothetical protein